MERFWKAALGVGGIAAIGAFVFWSLYSKWLALPSVFAQLTPQQTFIIMLVFLGLTFGALLSAFVLHAKTNEDSDDVLPLYERLRTGLSSPAENVAQIERIANSHDSRKVKYLREAAALPDISFMEVDAITQALDDLGKRKLVKNLKVRVMEREVQRIESTLPTLDDPLYKIIMVTAKYWRYANRKSHSSYNKVNEFIGVALVKGFNEEARALALQLEGEFRNAMGD
jgi:hypothetical protein